MEEHFKNKLKNHKVDWDKESLLGDLERELSPKKRRFNWRWFLLLPLMLLATCYGWNNLQTSEDNALSVNTVKTDSNLNENEEG